MTRTQAQLVIALLAALVVAGVWLIAQGTSRRMVPPCTAPIVGQSQPYPGTQWCPP